MNSKNQTDHAPITLSHKESKDGGLSTNAIQCPGLTPGAEEVHKLAGELPKRLAVFSYKQHVPYIWVIIAGGTGTGKSTVFNALCGKELSEAGVERPKTCGPIVYVHGNSSIHEGFPFPLVGRENHPVDSPQYTPASGNPGRLTILEHKREEWSHIVVVDTPDLDSVEVTNRQIAEDLYLLADVVIFVTSQEKYADEVPYQFLVRMMKEKKPYFLLLNKAQEPLSEEEVVETLKSEDLFFAKDRIWLIPYAPSDPFQWIPETPEFRDFIQCFSEELPAKGLEDFRKRQQAERAEDLTMGIGRLLDLLEQENGAGLQWLTELEGLYKKTSEDLIHKQKERFTEESREYLKREIRKLFTKYDVMAKPRRFVRDILLTPFRLLGFYHKGAEQSHKEDLMKIRQRLDHAPVQLGIDKFNRLVLENLSPSDESSPLFRKLRRPEMVLGDQEIKQRIWEEQDKLALWLEQTFAKLSKGISKEKEWGIYSTSILWGILILSFESVLGGGFTIIDVALDSALAPFLTKGATELFAYHEIQSVARELAQRYQEGLLSVLRAQHHRYEQCLKSLMTTQETMDSLQTLHSGMGN